MTFLLHLGGSLLPAAHRARWREETLALLLAVHGRRRWRYTADVLLKVPLLAWQLRRGSGVGRRSPGAVFAGAGLLLAAMLVVGAMTLSTVLGEDGAEAMLVLAPLALAPCIIRQVRQSVPYQLAAVPVIVCTAFGPVVAVAVLAAGRLAPPGLQPLLVTVGYAALAGPGAWLAVTSAAALRRRAEPPVLHALGLLSGGAFVLAIAALTWQIRAGGSPPALVGLVMFLALFTFLGSFLGWAVWAGLRLMFGAAGQQRG